MTATSVLKKAWILLAKGFIFTSEFMNQGTFGDASVALALALHFGTLIAVVAYFWRDWVEIISDCRFQISDCDKDDNKRYLLWLIVVATVPGVLVGFFLNDLAEMFLRHPLLLAFNLFFFGALLFLADKLSSKKRKVSEISLKDSILIGLSQALALVPGVSRSGITITSGLALGLDRKSAARFSFLMSTPVILGAVVYKLPDFLSASFGMAELLGILAAAISGYLAIAGLIRFVEKTSYKIFFWYRLGLAFLIILLWLTK